MPITEKTPTEEVVNVRPQLLNLAQLVFEQPRPAAVRFFTTLMGKDNKVLAAYIEAKRKGVFDLGACVQTIDGNTVWPPTAKVHICFERAVNGKLTPADMELLGLPPEMFSRVCPNGQATPAHNKPEQVKVMPEVMTKQPHVPLQVPDTNEGGALEALRDLRAALATALPGMHDSNERHFVALHQEVNTLQDTVRELQRALELVGRRYSDIRAVLVQMAMYYIDPEFEVPPPLDGPLTPEVPATQNVLPFTEPEPKVQVREVHQNEDIGRPPTQQFVSPTNIKVNPDEPLEGNLERWTVARLKSINVQTVGELCKTTLPELQAINRFGTKCIDQVQEFLAERGLTLADVEDTQLPPEPNAEPVPSSNEPEITLEQLLAMSNEEIQELAGRLGISLHQYFRGSAIHSIKRALGLS